MTAVRNTLPIVGLLAALSMGVSFAQCVAAAEEPEPATAKAFHDARQLYDSGKMVEALAAFQKFEGEYKLSAFVPQTIYFQGWCFADMRKYPQAIAAFDRLFQDYPTASVVPEAILKQAECYRALTNYTKALERCREFEAMYPKHALRPQALLGEAWALVKLNDPNASRAVVETIRTEFPKDPVVSLASELLLGQILTVEGDYDGARNVYEQVATQQNDPRTTEGLFLAGEAMFGAKRYGDAITFYKCVPSKSNSIERIQQQINDLKEQPGPSTTYQIQLSEVRQLQTRFENGPDLRASALFRIAQCDRLLGRLTDANVAYREFLDTYPNDPLAVQAQIELGQVLAERRQRDQAEAAAKEFQKKYPDSALGTNVLFLRAETAFAAGQFQEALGRYQKFAGSTQNAQNLEVVDFRIAGCHFGLKDFGRARDDYKVFLQHHPVSPMTADVLFQLGRSSFALAHVATEPNVVRANLTDAILSYEQVHSKFPRSDFMSTVVFQLGYLYASAAAQGGDKTAATNYAKATAAFQEFVTRWPDNRLVPEALYQIGCNQFAQRRFAAATTAYEQVLQKHPDSEFAPFAAYEIADCFANDAKPEQMVVALRDFVKRYPNDVRVPQALYRIASQLESEKKLDEAIAAYREVISHATAAWRLTDNLRDAAIASELHIAAILNDRDTVRDAVADCANFLDKFQNEPVAVRAMITQIAALYRGGNRSDDAYDVLDQLIAQHPHRDDVRIAALTSTIELALGEHDTQRAYTAAWKLLADPERDHLPSASYIAIGNALTTRGEFARARDAFQKSIALYPNDTRTLPLALLGLANADLKLDQLDDAEKSFNQVLAANSQGPLFADAQLGIGEVCLARARGKGSMDPQNVLGVELLNKVMATAEGDTASQAAYALGNYFFHLRDNEKDNKKTALAYYLRAALQAGGPIGEEAAFRTGECHRALGNIEAARSAYQAYLRRFPNGRFSEQAKEELLSLVAPPEQS